MKAFLLIIFLYTSVTYGQTGEYVLERSSNKVTTYIMKEGSYMVYYLDSTISFKNQTYNVRLREYSGGNIDTGFIRKDTNYYYSGNYNGEETIMLPRKPLLGQKWYATDSSWVFEIKSINAQLATPVKKYTNLVEVIATNKLYVEGDDLLAKYYNFYAKGIGFVGSIVDGKLFSYLKTIQKK